MNNDELRKKMLEFIETQDGDSFNVWCATPKGFTATILSDFAEHLGIEMVVPEYIPTKTKPQINRDEMLNALLPHINQIF